MHPSTPITAVIITNNEERNIARCLESLRGIADEVIVVDSGSTDQTEAICHTLGATFIRQEWLGYSAQKNFGNSRAAHDWILSLDADEALSDILHGAILHHKKNGLQGAFRFNRLTNYCGHWVRHCGWYPDKKTRLFHRQQARWEGQFVHEELVVQAGISVTDLPGDLLHYSYYTVQEHRERSLKYARLGAEKIAAKKSTSFLKPHLSAATRFVQMYLLKAGFLDGWAGWKIATITAKETFMKYSLARKLKIKIVDRRL